MNYKYLFVLIVLTTIFVSSPAWAEENSTQMTGDAGIDSQIKVTAIGDGSYFLNEEITFSGTNAESDYVYLFITGPTLQANGNKLNDLLTAAVTGDEESFVRVKVNADKTWIYRLDNAVAGLDPGTYTIYSVTEPKNKTSLSGAIYDTASIVIKKPFISAEVSDLEIKNGEELTIEGNCIGGPDKIGIWVFGFDYWNGAETGSMVTVKMDPDGSYRYIIGGNETANMDSGEYFVVAQHPMYNGQLDVIARPGSDEGTILVSEREPANQTPDPGFVVWGSFALRGADAADALVEGINSPNIDDSYAVCTFSVFNQSENISEDADLGVFEAFGNYIVNLLQSFLN